MFAVLFNFSPAGSDPPQGTMSNLQLVSNADGEITLTWDAPSPMPDDYRIVWAEDSLGWLSWTRTNEANRGNDYPSGLLSSSMRTSYTISGLTPGDTIKVRARTRYTPDGPSNSNRHWSGPWTPIMRVTVSGTIEPEPVTETLTISTTEFDVNENETTVGYLLASTSDTSITDPMVWTIAGGDDSSHFSLKSNGALAFDSAKDFEAPDDADADGVYEVDVTVTRGDASATASLEVTLVDVEDDDTRRSEPTIEDEEDENADGPPAPDAPTVKDVYKTKVMVHWTEPEVEDGDDPITSYDIQYKVHDATQWTDGPQDWTEDPRDRGLFVDIRDLVPDINYLFRVRSQAGETEGPWSDAIEQTTALWDSRLRSEPSADYCCAGILGFNTATSSGWFSNRNIVHNGLTRRIETLGRYQSRGHHTRPIGDDEALRHRVSLDFHVTDHELPADWVLKIGSRTYKISDADHRQERPPRSGRDAHVWLTFWVHVDVPFPQNREVDVALFRDPTLSQRGVDHLPEDEPETEDEEAVGGQADEEEVGGKSDEQQVGGQSDGGKVPATVTVTNPEPTRVKARVTNDGVVLTWNAPTEGNVISYRIYRGTDANNLLVLVSDTGSTDTRYVDQDVQEGTAYAYAVQPNLEDTSGLNGGSQPRGLGNSGLSLEELLNAGTPRISTRNHDPQNNENTMSALVWARTLVTIEVRVGPDRSLLRSLPQDSSGTQILPVSTPSAIFRHTWMNATLEEYVHYAADLEQNSFYNLVLWDPQHAENSLQLSGGYITHDFQYYGPGADVLVYDIQDEIREISETLAQGGPLIPEVYYFHLTGIRVGAKNGPDLYTAPRDSQWGDLSQLHYLALGTQVRSYVFHTGATPGWHYFELRMRRSHLVHHIRLEKLYDHPDLPSSVATIKRSAKVRGRYGWLEGSEYGVITPGDEDWFRIYLEGNKHYEFVLEGSGSFLNLERGDIVGLSGPDGILIPSTTSGGSRLGYRTPVDGGGNYYVGVRSSSDAGTGVYRITARETDIGSGTGTQVTLPLGREYLSFFHEPHDRDTFKVEVKADRKYRARIYPYGDRGSPWSLRHSFDLHIEDDICERNTCSRVTDHQRDIRNAGNHSEMVEFSTRHDTTVYITVTNEDGFRGSYYFKVWDVGSDD